MGMLGQQISQSDQDALIERIRQYIISQQNPQQNPYLQNSYAQNTGVTDIRNGDPSGVMQTPEWIEYQKAIRDEIIPKETTFEAYQSPYFEKPLDPLAAKSRLEKQYNSDKELKNAALDPNNPKHPDFYKTHYNTGNGWDWKPAFRPK
jgi:hypothetical protein